MGIAHPARPSRPDSRHQSRPAAGRGQSPSMITASEREWEGRNSWTGWYAGESRHDPGHHGGQAYSTVRRSGGSPINLATSAHARWARSRASAADAGEENNSSGPRPEAGLP